MSFPHICLFCLLIWHMADTCATNHKIKGKFHQKSIFCVLSINHFLGFKAGSENVVFWALIEDEDVSLIYWYTHITLIGAVHESWMDVNGFQWYLETHSHS